MTTQSQLVDELVAESLRPDMRAMISGYVTQTIRELHNDPQSRAAILFPANMYEAELVANQTERYTWQFPRPQLFQAMESVYYVNMGTYARQRSPSSAHAFSQEVLTQQYFYRTGDSIAFAGYGGENARIHVAFYEYVRSLVYKTASERKVQWDADSQQYKYAADITTPEQRTQALERETNWILSRHDELVRQGTRAKLYSRLKDVERARLSYSLYESLRPSMIDAETAQARVFYTR